MLYANLLANHYSASRKELPCRTSPTSCVTRFSLQHPRGFSIRLPTVPSNVRAISITASRRSNRSRVRSAAAFRSIAISSKSRGRLCGIVDDRIENRGKKYRAPPPTEESRGASLLRSRRYPRLTNTRLALSEIERSSEINGGARVIISIEKLRGV